MTSPTLELRYALNRSVMGPGHMAPLESTTVAGFTTIGVSMFFPTYTNNVMALSDARSRYVVAPMISSTSGIRSSFVRFIIVMDGEQAWNFTPASWAVLIISLIDGIFIPSIFFFIMRVARRVI